MSEPKAGRDLDAEVAEKIIGLPGVGYYRRESWFNTKWIPCEPDDEFTDSPPLKLTPHLYFRRNGGKRDDPNPEVFAVPLYSTDIAAAWAVVERMREHPEPRFQNLFMVAWCYNRTYATFDADLAMDSAEWCEANGEHATPLAICLAALAAVRGATEGET